MRFMVIVNATPDSEGGVMPPASPLKSQKAGVLLNGAGLFKKGCTC
jgi:hypothetical protein